MRISDWSSDVCSSDLVVTTGNFAYSSSKSHAKRCLLLGDAYAFVDPVFSSGVFLAMQSAFVGSETVDRKSVGQGKSVSVRVDLGGRRIIKKKQIRGPTAQNHILQINTKTTNEY